jgi:hypothetical protein
MLSTARRIGIRRLTPPVPPYGKQTTQPNEGRAAASFGRWLLRVVLFVLAGLVAAADPAAAAEPRTALIVGNAAYSYARLATR